MKRGMRFILCTVAALGFAPIAAWAQSCDTTFEPKDKDGYDVDEGAWQDDDNWTNDAPGSGDVGCVPSGKTANVYKKYCKGGLTHGLDCSGTACVFGTCYEDPDIEAGAVVLDGTLELHYYTSLTISDDSVDSEVNGEMIVRPYAKIVTDGDVTITGDEGGEIFGAYIVCAYTHPQIDYVKRCDGGTNDGEICEDNEDCPGDPPGVCTAQTLTLDGDKQRHCRRGQHRAPHRLAGQTEEWIWNVDVLVGIGGKPARRTMGRHRGDRDRHLEARLRGRQNRVQHRMRQSQRELRAHRWRTRHRQQRDHDRQSRHDRWEDCRCRGQERQLRLRVSRAGPVRDTRQTCVSFAVSRRPAVSRPPGLAPPR